MIYFESCSDLSSDPGLIPSSNPDSDPGSNPGSDPGSKFRYPRGQLVVSCQVVTTPCCGLAVIFRGFFSHLIGSETINFPDIFSGVHGFTGKT